MSEPLACALPADEAERRARQTRATLGGAALSREQVESGVRLRFPAEPAIERQLRETIEAESRCCPFLAMELRAADDELELTVTGPAEAGPIIEHLVG